MKILYSPKNSSDIFSVILVFMPLSRTLDCYIMLYCYMQHSVPFKGSRFGIRESFLKVHESKIAFCKKSANRFFLS